MNIEYIAELITEDPDVFHDHVLLEAPDSFYVPSFNKSTTHIPHDYQLGFDPTSLGWSLSYDEHPALDQLSWMIPDPEKQTKRVAFLKDLPTEERVRIIHLVKSIVPPELVKFEPYYMKQMIAGHLHLTRINEDSERINSTIALFVKMSRKAAWEGPKDLFKWPNWRILERQVKSFADKHIDYDASQDSEVHFTKSYQNNAFALLLGGPPEITTYWFRSVTTPEAACKYGKGTTWCTSSTPGPRGTPEYDQHYAHDYIKQAGLYIIEMQTPTIRRHPILQISGDQFMNANDIPITRVGPRLADFIVNVLQIIGNKLHPFTYRALTNHIDDKMLEALKMKSDLARSLLAGH